MEKEFASSTSLITLFSLSWLTLPTVPSLCLSVLCATVLCRVAFDTHGLPYPSRTLTLFGVLTYQHTWFCLFSFFFSRPRDRQNFFSPPPRVLSPIVSLFTFNPTLHLPDFLQPACFSACLLLLRVSLCPCGTARRGFVSVCYSSKRVDR